MLPMTLALHNCSQWPESVLFRSLYLVSFGFRLTVTLNYFFQNLSIFLAPRNLRVNVANDQYQIFEWDSPGKNLKTYKFNNLLLDYGVPEKIRLEILRGGEVLHTMEVDGEETIAMSKTQFQSGPEYTVRAISSDLEGSTPSGDNQFVLLNNGNLH